MSPEAFYDYAQRFFDKYEFLNCYDRKLICSLLQNRIEIFDDIGPAMEFLTKFDGYDLNLLCNQKWKTDLNTAKEMLPGLSGLPKRISIVCTTHSSLSANRTAIKRVRCCGFSVSQSPAHSPLRAELPKWQNCSERRKPSAALKNRLPV